MIRVDNIIRIFMDREFKFNLTFLKHTIFIKIIVMLSTVISPYLLYQIIGKLTLNLTSLNSSFGFRLYLRPFVFLLANPFIFL